MIKYREHTFRAWDIQNEMMYMNPFHFLQDWENKDLYTFYQDWGDYDDGISRSGYIMQYTGFKDINNKEIYEGDIVKSLNHNPRHFQVEFIEAGFCCTHPLLKGYPTDINHFYPSVGCQIKVVGNIFQNPELLTK